METVSSGCVVSVAGLSLNWLESIALRQILTSGQEVIFPSTLTPPLPRQPHTKVFFPQTFNFLIVITSYYTLLLLTAQLLNPEHILQMLPRENKHTQCTKLLSIYPGGCK